MNKIAKAVAGVHPLIKIQASLGGVVAVALAVAGALEHVSSMPYVASVAAGAVTVLSAVAQLLGQKHAAKKGS